MPIVATNVIALGRRVFVWMVGITGALGSVGQLTISFIHREIVDAIVWLMIAVLMVAFAVMIENLKTFLDG